MAREIAIYIDCSPERFAEWVGSIAGPLNENQKIGDTSTIYSGPLGRIVVSSNDEDSFLEVTCFLSPSPWATHADCGRQAARELKCRVRCEPGAEYPEVIRHSETALEIDGTKEPLEERLFEWVDDAEGD